MEKVVEDIEREEDEQERKRSRADGDRRHKKGINLTDEEKRSRILAEAQKRMQMNMKSVQKNYYLCSHEFKSILSLFY